MYFIALPHTFQAKKSWYGFRGLIQWQKKSSIKIGISVLVLTLNFSSSIISLIMEFSVQLVQFSKKLRTEFDSKYAWLMMNKI